MERGTTVATFEHNLHCNILLDPSQAAVEGSEPHDAPKDAGIARSDHRVRVLFERCLIACALYEELWTRVGSGSQMCPVIP